MSTFVLAHGAWHGAWCWDAVAAELTHRGHDAVAMDLPVDDPQATFDDYADAVCAAIDHHGDSAPIVVGHSLAGHVIPRVAARRSVAHLVYVCALIPEPGRSFYDQNTAGDIVPPERLAGLSEFDELRRRRWVDPELTRRALFHDCDEAVFAAAYARLRPQAAARFAEPFHLDELPSVDSTYVLCTDDYVVSPAWSRRLATSLLNADLVELPGGHSPELARPSQLADLLGAVAGKALPQRV